MTRIERLAMTIGGWQDEQLEAMAGWTLVQVAFHASRENMTRLIEAHPGLAGSPVPACPAWTVRDLLAHVVGHCRPELSDEGDGAKPLHPIEELGVGELLDEWAWTGPRAERSLAENEFRHRIWVMDMFTHELDLRRTVGAPLPDEQHPGFRIAWGVVLGGFSASIAARGMPACALRRRMPSGWPARGRRPAPCARIGSTSIGHSPGDVPTSRFPSWPGPFRRRHGCPRSLGGLLIHRRRHRSL
ncbi:hypothetical protein ABH935_005713 [Catenulispora sp. GAS73]|uniref:hypothetical protein n=1 Tax=Catenulispora sp. GAS73 TaxID=3156269 RepID=UPI003512B32F